MLTVEPAAGNGRSQRRIALALAGGGPLGAFYQLGCLHALSECTEGLDLAQLDAYVGVSSGEFLQSMISRQCEMVSYVGTGNSTPYSGWHRDPSRGDNLFLVSILAIDPAAFGDPVEFRRRVDTVGRDMRASERMPGP